MVNFSRSELLELFFQEVQSYIPQMKKSLLDVIASGDMEAAAELHRLFHNVKGAASQVQLGRLSQGARVVEDFLAGIVEEGNEMQDTGMECVGKVVELLDIFVEAQSAEEKIEERFLQTVMQMQWPAPQEQEESEAQSLEEIRSIFPLLHELTDCIGEDSTARRENELVYTKLITALTALTEMAVSVGLAKQGRLLEDFCALLAIIAPGGEPCQDEIAGVVKDFFHFAELAFVEDQVKRGQAVEKVQRQLRGIKLLVESSPQKAVTSGEQGETDYLAENHNDLFDEVAAFDESIDFIDQPFDSDDLFATEVEPVDSDEAESGVDHLDSFENEGEDEGDVVASVESGADSGGAADAESGLGLEAGESALLAEIFKEECDEHFIAIHSSLHELEKLVHRSPEDKAAMLLPLGAIRRAVHTLKGAAAMTGVELLADGAHRLEDTLDFLHDNNVLLGEDDIQLIGRSVEILESLSSFGDEQQITELHNSLEIHLEAKKIAVVVDSPVEDEKADVVALLAEAEHGHHRGGAVLPEETSSLRVRLDDLDELLAVEGELVVARVAIEKRVSELSLALGHLEDVKDNLRRRCQELESGFEVKALYGGKGTHTGGPLPLLLAGAEAGGALDDFDPLELDRYSELNLIIRSLNEIAVDVNSIHTTLESLTREIGGQAAKQQLTMRQMQEKMMRIRMIPLSSISRVFHTTVRSAAATLEKPVDFDIVGEDVYMDRFVWTMVTDPLLHILRNAVDHGIESRDDRLAAGKAERGRITLHAEQHSRHVVLTVEDDGAGIDLEAVKNNIRSGGMVADVDGMRDADIIDHIFYPSFSTKTDISRLSGRGVGLDVARKNVENLRGTIHVSNNPGAGLKFELRIPFSLSVNRAVLVRVGADSFAIPLQDIDEIRQYQTGDVRRGEEPGLLIDDAFLPFAHLGSYVDVEVEEDESNGVAILVSLPSAGQGEGRRALAVSEILEQREIVVKGLGTHLTHVQGIAGVTVTGSGDLIPILNIKELIGPGRVKENVKRVDTTAKQAGSPLKVLIVDDSISVRFSIARLVESQGWEQKQAVDGVEALNMLESYTPDVIILDIEMPRMNGYELKSNINNREEFQDIPVVMLTSRMSQKHQQKARELGVDHYLTKPYEEEQFVQLLKNIEMRSS